MAWSLASRATWREPTDQGLCNADGSRAVGGEDEQLSFATSATATTTTTPNPEQESKETASGGSKRLHGKVSRVEPPESSLDGRGFCGTVRD